MPNKIYRLLTNIAFVSMGFPKAMKLDCHAILLQPAPSPLSDMPQGGQIRGFLTDGALPIFTMPLDCGHLDYKMRLARSTHVMMETEDGVKPLFSGHNLTFDDDVEVNIVLEDPKRKLDVAEFDDINAVWKALPRKVLEYWQAPAMPVRSYLPVHSVPQYLDYAQA